MYERYRQPVARVMAISHVRLLEKWPLYRPDSISAAPPRGGGAVSAGGTRPWWPAEPTAAGVQWHENLVAAGVGDRLKRRREVEPDHRAYRVQRHRPELLRDGQPRQKPCRAEGHAIQDSPL